MDEIAKYEPTSSPEQDSSLFCAVVKLMEVIAEENTLLREHRITSHAGFSDRKNQILRELMAIQSSRGAGSASMSCRALLAKLAGALQVNARLLKLHIAAVGEISDIIIGGLREAEADGTYSRNRYGGA